jgi:hypothetical protein
MIGAVPQSGMETNFDILSKVREKKQNAPVETVRSVSLHAPYNSREIRPHLFSA